MSYLEDPPPCPPTCGADRHPREWCDFCYWSRVPTIYLFDTWSRAELKRAIGAPGWHRVQAFLRERLEYDPRPIEHAMACAFGDDVGDGWAPCSCELEARQRRWDDAHRAPTAAPTPRAIVRVPEPPRGLVKYFLFRVAQLFARA